MPPTESSILLPYVAAYSAKQGIWRLSWDQLQEARAGRRSMLGYRAATAAAAGRRESRRRRRPAAMARAVSSDTVHSRSGSPRPRLRRTQPGHGGARAASSGR